MYRDNASELPVKLQKCLFFFFFCGTHPQCPAVMSIYLARTLPCPSIADRTGAAICVALAGRAASGREQLESWSAAIALVSHHPKLTLT